MTTAAKNDNASKTPTFDAVLAALSATYTGTDRWVLEGWATHIREARHALRAINSLVKYAAEIGDAAWPAAFDLACVEDDAQGERLSVIAEAEPDARVLHDEGSTRELYRERAQNNR